MRARVILLIQRKHLDINEDVEDVLPVTPAVDTPLNVPDPVLLPVDFVPLDVPNANLGGLPAFAVTAWMGWNVQASSDWTRGHIEFPEDLRKAERPASRFSESKRSSAPAAVG